MEYRSFLIKKDNGQITVNPRKTNSILQNRLQLDYLLHFKNYIKGDLIDVGCGEKPYSLVYDSLCTSSVGIDVETCKHEQKYVDIFASADDIPFEDERFDTVLCTNVVEHTANMDKVFSELARVCKTGGYLILSVPFLYPTHEAPYDFYRYTEYGLKHQLKKNGFEIKQFVTWGGLGFFLLVYFNMFFCKLLKVKFIEQLFCHLQSCVYLLYKKTCFNSLIKKQDKSRINKSLTMGFEIIARKRAK